MNTERLQRSAELLLVAIRNVKLAEENLFELKHPPYTNTPAELEEKYARICEAEEGITATEETLKRQIKYTITELQEI